MSSPTGDADISKGMIDLFNLLVGMGPAGIVAAVMWMWKEREAKRADALQEKFNTAIDRALDGDDRGH